VSKLFNLFGPDRAYFGQKDFQQTVVIGRMVRDLLCPVELVTVPTVREPDGLALSSRNVYLSEAERRAARAIPRALQAAWEAERARPGDWASAIASARSVLASEPGLEVQYLEAVDASTLAVPADQTRQVVVALAAYAGKTRLIDNTWLPGPSPLDSPSSGRLESTP
jgi:pantoate--beta-alanine ligase